ncbi:DUF1501 domain-containing protein, partial [Verrucomicrobiales bacterium]|nr:DUF1501 domain-containing protein [Verrucomicrobiales bacterium]
MPNSSRYFIDALNDRPDRRDFLLKTGHGLGAAALSSLFARGTSHAADPHSAPAGSFPNFDGTAKRVIYLFMAGGPSHIDTFDYKPELRKIHGQELPDSIRNGQRIT